MLDIIISSQCAQNRYASKNVNPVEVVMIEKLDCILSKRATRPIYMRVQVRLNAISPYQSQQSSPAIRGISVSGHTRHLRLRPYKIPPSPAIPDSSPAETSIWNKPVQLSERRTILFL